ncbi:hypothetical protein DFQ28_002136 [Apophysomyces sp. BC1034]|nr:hypothetical protein DFQ30_002539 [Apophysomyces sp. BC1015]KAG0179817.1 hypothetical protein DFQ29_001626 [Apophysomyces sp. BC1021]KAG0190392.1 hypothetical protein DFQ28_002136 [Apophysomyces sp. BC1034]
MATGKTFTIEAFGTTKEGPFKPTTYESRPLGEHDIYVKMKASGICHTDCMYMGMVPPNSVLGHEPVGTVVEVGSAVKRLKVGDLVGYSYLRKSCLDCYYCSSGNDIMCRERVLFPEGGGNGFAKGAVVDSRFAYKIPDGIEAKHAGPLMCAGITVFNALYQAKLLPTARVAVVGIGGLGHLGLQFARAWGCHVTAISRSMSKKDEALAFGAHDFLNSDNFTPDYIKTLEKYDLILDTVSADLDWDLYMSLLRPNGNICLIGVPHNPIEIKQIFPLIQEQIGIRGSMVGGRATIQLMFEFASRHNIKPTVEEFPFTAEGLTKGIDLCHKNKARYRAVLVADD